MNVALVEDAEHDVDDDDRGENQERFALQRGTEFRRAAGKGGRVTVSGRPMSCSAAWIASTACAERTARTEVEGKCDRRELAFVDDGSGAVPVLTLAKALNGTIWPVVDLT